MDWSELAHRRASVLPASARDLARGFGQECLVCGHPTGDCVGESHSADGMTLLGSPEDLSGPRTLVHEDVWEDVRDRFGARTTVLRFAAGQTYSLARVEAHGGVRHSPVEEPRAPRPGAIGG